MVSSRKSTLIKIMEIDDEINRIKSDSTYRRVRRNLRILKEARTGGRLIRVRSPDDIDRFIDVRRNSEEMKEVLSKYENMVEDYTQRVRNLVKEKAQLEKNLFA
jgi:uncharacterized protein involved in exopolysaccharide biosynthesis